MSTIEDKDLILKRQQYRYQLLYEIWRYSGGDKWIGRDFYELAEELKVPKDEAEPALQYLIGEGLLDRETMTDGGTIGISHYGVKEIEDSIWNPNQATDHFSISVIQHFHGQVGAVQNAPHSTAQIHQQIGIPAEEILLLLTKVREDFKKLPIEVQAEAKELADEVEQQAQSPGPKKSLINACLTRLNDIAKQAEQTALSAAIDHLMRYLLSP